MNTSRKSKIINSKSVQLIIQTLRKWQQDECLEMGAALAYYGIFSLFPLLFVILSILGFLLGNDTDVHKQILSLAQSSLPPEAYNIVISTLNHLNKSSIGAGLVGFFLLLFTASSIFAALKRFVNKIWQVQRLQNINNGWIASSLNFLKVRILAFFMVLGAAILPPLSMLSGIAIDIILKILDNFDQSIFLRELDTLLVIQGLQKSATFLIVSLAFVVLFKILPSTKVAWGDVWLGALITAFLFRCFRLLVSNSIIQIGSQFLSYGVVGSIMILLLWIYINFQLFLLGCEFTYVYAHLFGSRRQRKER